jgi:hypothetical protein
MLRRELPARFQDRPTDHSVHTVRGYLRDQLGVDVDSEPDARDWLTFPEQALLIVTSGRSITTTSACRRSGSASRTTPATSGST